jgi:hypothetical protein
MVNDLPDGPSARAVLRLQLFHAHVLHSQPKKLARFRYVPDPFISLLGGWIFDFFEFTGRVTHIFHRFTSFSFRPSSVRIRAKHLRDNLLQRKRQGEDSSIEAHSLSKLPIYALFYIS